MSAFGFNKLKKNAYHNRPCTNICNTDTQTQTPINTTTIKNTCSRSVESVYTQ